MSYTPSVNDYVKWHTTPETFKGWVYFKCDQYITIEIGVKCKDQENIEHCPIHKKTHCLLLCFKENWGELEYVKSRDVAEADETIRMYKSQEYRHTV